MKICQFKVVYTQLVCRESPRKTVKDGTPILLKTCCFNDIEHKILDLPEAYRCRTTPRSSNNKTLNARLLARVITGCHYT